MHHKHRFFFLFPVLFTFSVLSSCHKGNGNPHPDISKVPEPAIKIVRLEQMLVKANSDNYPSVFAGIAQQYPEIFTAYCSNFWGLVSDSTHPVAQVYDSLYVNAAGNEWMQRLNDSVQLTYTDIQDVQEEIQKALQYYKYYFPDSSLPLFYSYIGPFVYQTLFDEKTMGIELDMYMGKHFGYYGSYENNIPEYIARRCDRPYIVVNVMQSLMDGNIYSGKAEATLLDEMIAQGKMLYYLDCVLPDVSDSIKIGYTDTQLQWCYDNKGEIWKYLAGEELLFSKKIDDIRRYANDAPTSMGMPEDAPGRVAIWMGWQIVRDYMHEHKNVTLTQLFAEPDALKILKDSGFNADK